MFRVIEYLLILQFAVLVCSYPDEDDDGRIIGGQDAKIGEFPYQVSLRYFNETAKRHTHVCGGSIIGDEWILTAGHCVVSRNPQDGVVVAGTNLLSQGGQVYNIQKFVIHEEYLQPTRYHNDIALIKLSSKIRLNPVVKKISLPEEDTLAGAEAILSGWGFVKFEIDNHSNLITLPTDKLQKINLKTISYKECVKGYEDSKRFVRVYPENICTVGKMGKGACKGDSGGPLVVDGKQVGIVSFAKPCAHGAPDAFTRVYKYLDWIHVHMEKE